MSINPNPIDGVILPGSDSKPLVISNFVHIQGVYVKSLHFLNKVFSVFLLNKMLLNMTLLLQNFARIQNMPIFLKFRPS